MEKTESAVVDASANNPTDAQPRPEISLQPQQVDPSGLDLVKEGFRRILQPRNLVGFLWLGPSIAILVLNFRGHIIGAGLNCGSHCRIDPYSTSQIEQIDRLDGTNRDVLGALQFVAKGLEIWFMYVAAGFIYRIALHLSAKDNRLPVSLLLVYAEFMDLLYLKDLAVKAKDLAMEKNQTATNPTPTNKMARPVILYVFIFVAAALCVIANLMGVATATLIIPGLQWIDINKDESLAFGELLSAVAPQDDNIARCREGQLADGAYSCTDNLYGASLDELVEAAVATERQFEGRQAVLLPPVSQEANLTFSANVSQSAAIQWAPNRQLLRGFSADLVNYYVATTSNTGLNDSYPDSHRFNQSLQAQLQRVGPTVGLAGSCWIFEGLDIFNVSSDREVRCYEGLSLLNGTTATKCIRWGSGWNDNSTSASFTILDSVAQLYDMDVSIYTTPAARYLRDQSCLRQNSCNWDQLFADPPDPLFRNISSSQQTYEYSMPQYTNNSAIWCDNTAFLSFAAYALNPSPVSNLLQLVQLGVLHDDPGSEEETSAAATISIHPSWTLAAWSANATDGLVPGTRGSSTRIIDAFQRFTSSPEDNSLRFNLIHSYTLLQAVSLIPYTTRTISTVGDRDRNAQRQREADSPYTQATLTSWATVQLWKFGIDSRTKTLGVVIFIIGMVVVFVTTVLWFESPKSPTSIVVTALMHPPPADGVVADAETGAPLRARLKYQHMQGQGNGEGDGDGAGDVGQTERVRPRRAVSWVFSPRAV